MKIKHGLLVLLITVLMAQEGKAWSGDSIESAQRVRFRSGATNALVQGWLTRDRPSVYYLVRAKAGQMLRLKVQTLSGANSVVPLVFVRPPRGHFSGEKSNVYKVRVKRSGDFLIRVAPNLMASNGTSGIFRLRVVVE